MAGNVARVRDRGAFWVLVRNDERKRVIGRHKYRWPENFETLTVVTHLLITKYILKLAGICGFCNVNICT